MAEYITREDIVAVGANALTDNYDDANPGEIEAPTGHIGQIIYAGIARMDTEASTLVAGMRLTGDAITGNPVIALGGYGFGGSGTGTSNTIMVPPLSLDVDIPIAQGKKLRIIGLVAGTSGDEIAMSITLVFN